VLCEIGKSTFRGREVLYPSLEFFGESTAAANKDYLMDWAHFQILVDVIGAKGIEPNPDVALFENVDIRTEVGGIPLKIPVMIAGLGSTKVAKNNWHGLAIGAAISGTIQTVGENVCGMDMESIYTNGKVQHSPDLKFRVDTYRKFWDGKHGDIVVQTNVEDQRGGVDIYAISKLEVNVIERKWGQGAKAIGGEVRIHELEKAQKLKQRGYVVLPDPEDDDVINAFKSGVFKTFERHSRVGFPEFKGFIEDIEWLKSQGAKKVFLKTGAYRPSVVAFTFKCASEAKVDAITFDGAGGGTGMSPVPMMQECATPTVYLEAQVLRCVEILKRRGKHIPDIVMAGGFIDETQIFKSIAMSNFGDEPHVKAIAMARAPITAAMKGAYFSELAKEEKLPKKFSDMYTMKPEKFFITVPELQARYPDAVVGVDIPWGAVGVYTYFTDRIGIGLKQLMAGCRKWKLNLLDRSDLAALTERASETTGITLIDKVEYDAIEGILEF
jgi:hypothetical protein